MFEIRDLLHKIGTIKGANEEEILKAIKKINETCKVEEIVNQLYPYIKLADSEICKLKGSILKTLVRLQKKKVIVKKGSQKVSEWGLPSFFNDKGSLLATSEASFGKRIVGVLY